ncbi:arginine/serine-rich coiled-coil protein 2-like [Ostrinia furnacalis]|uniref:arginine/serine-rich coiled-coil protein 2-like n=1 Tax=Ostrinia furnacalis TaxID=93504 RepID=UPI00103A2F34|nr:arginine/serine-rich coiled-coil protein 2-like [Ostrinia furnacalis]
MSLNGGMEAEGDEEKKKKINEDVIVFLRKRSETNAPKYAARLKTYVDLQHKRRRAAAARRHSEQMLRRTTSSRKRNDMETNKTGEVTDHRGGDEDETRVGKRRGDKNMNSRSFSRSRSGEPSDRCGRRRRKRRRSCGRRRKKRRRRRSCGRRRRRRRKRSCSRRRRRRSCRRRRKKRRRRRC